MNTEIMLWQVNAGKLTKLPKKSFSSEHKEKDLEKWVESDPSILGKELSVIGRQVYIPKVGPLDLLAMDQAGRLVVVEFKHHQTTRDTIAQILDYASAIRLMEVNDIASLSNVDPKELEDVTDVDPTMILVAAEADDSVERIVDYLASRASLPIEVVTFTYATLADGQEIIARSILVPETAPVVIPASGNRQLSDILRIAKDRKVDQILSIIAAVKSIGIWEEVVPSHRSYLRYSVITISGGDKTLFSIDVVGGRLDSPEASLDLWIFPEAASEFTGLTPETTWKEAEEFVPVKKTSTKVFLRVTTTDSARKIYEMFARWKMLNTEAMTKVGVSDDGPSIEEG